MDVAVRLSLFSVALIVVIRGQPNPAGVPTALLYSSTLVTAAPNGHINWVISPAVTTASFNSIPPPSSAPLCNRGRNGRKVVLLYLLFIGGVERNPGPGKQGTSRADRGRQGEKVARDGGKGVAAGGKEQLSVGVLNIRSAVNKAALIHDTIISERLNILVLTETNIPFDAPPAVKDDIAPDGFSVLHSPRVGRKKRSGGGIAVIYHSTIDMLPVRNSFTAATSFESLCCRFIIGNRRINLLAVYRPPPRATQQFFDELSNMCNNIETLPGDFLMCGDFNTPGESQSSIDNRLSELLCDAGYKQFVDSPTRKSKDVDNVLDLVISRAEQIRLETVTLTNIAFSDHRLVQFLINLPKLHASTVIYSCRDLRNIDTYRFADLLRSSTIYTAPPTGLDDYVKQLDKDVKKALDVIAPVRKHTKRMAAKLHAAWLMDKAKAAKRHSRRLERRYKRTGAEEDYIRWRKAGRLAVHAVNSARTNYYRDTVQQRARKHAY